MNKDKPFFSIIIPTYNRAAFILNTLQTVLDQTFQDYEIIVVDNCSTDNTKEILRPLMELGKICFIQNDRNYERAKSRNTGMQNAKGQFLTFLDSDDFMYKNNLKDAHDFIKSHPGYSVFHNLYELVDENHQCIYSYSFSPITNPLRQIAEGNFLSCIGVFISKDVYTKVLWDENPLLTGSEDYEYWLRVIATFEKVGRIKKVNNGILNHPARTINTADIAQAEKRFAYFFSKLDQDPLYLDKFKNYCDKIKSTLYIFLAGMARDIQDKEKFKYYLKSAWKVDKTVIYRKNFLSLFLKLIKE